MGSKLSTSGRGRWLAVAVSLTVSAGMVYAQTAAPPRQPQPSQSSAAEQDPTPSMAAPPPTEAELLAASAPADARVFDFALPAGVAPEGGLQVKTIWAARAISTMFPEITTIGGYRQDPLKWHPNGLAIDVMIPNHNSEEGIELGNQIAGYALANAKRWGVLHVIWRQGFYPGIGAPSWTADYGSETLNHFDHVHIATDGGGYPTGNESYFIASMQR
ncbi:glycoside hydrolase [Mycolicibacterium austroafricanum]|uniref:glycoside hydrolase n=1 Tax=Mycolicibacterium austroafricanum TaxID=39687 RepID=UPI001CA327DE|nr:glycoside hydrolase [Mycolicibacterium austroafricanum]QZT65043.1 glycoside hydrolase [Mycolicibacterium austroafricanum]